MSDKFIHHETINARFAHGDGAGRYNVIEDDYGFYVSNADEGFISGRYTDSGALRCAIQRAQLCADAFDAKILAAFPLGPAYFYRVAGGPICQLIRLLTPEESDDDLGPRFLVRTSNAEEMEVAGSDLSRVKATDTVAIPRDLLSELSNAIRTGGETQLLSPRSIAALEALEAFEGEMGPTLEF